jgi:hypothetical protein
MSKCSSVEVVKAELKNLRNFHDEMSRRAEVQEEPMLAAGHAGKAWAYDKALSIIETHTSREEKK